MTELLPELPPRQYSDGGIAPPLPSRNQVKKKDHKKKKKKKRRDKLHKKEEKAEELAPKHEIENRMLFICTKK